VKVQAAIYADGNSAGVPEKVAQVLARRRFVLETTRVLIARLEKTNDKAAAIADLKQWSDSMPGGRRNSQEAVNQTAGRALIEDTVTRIDQDGLEDALAKLRRSEKALAK